MRTRPLMLVASLAFLAPLLAAPLASDTAPAAPQAKVDTMAARQAALENPFDDAAFEAYLATLPFDGDFYILEGDLRATRGEVLNHLVTEAGGSTPAVSNPELLLAKHAGERSVWPVEARALTYAIDRASFPDERLADQVAAEFQEAARAWVDACHTCGLSFTHAAKYDTAPSVEAVTFIVRYTDANAYIAAAFFPHDIPARRQVMIDKSYFSTSFDQVGVLRHEIGHILGYRHEHIRGIDGCFQEGGTWVPLSEYDPNSVMHYFCGGGGSFALDLSARDIAGHQLAYQP